MKSLFKRRTEPFVYHKIYLLVRKRWAEKMQRATAGLSKTKLVCGLVLFTVMASSYLIYNLYKAFYKETEAPAASKIKTINLKN
ncbi:hypothetical protein [Flavobacterium johnsoniae]|uniref:Uncharacterized protein n=1 Tax=Flavobacterium johnsoniae TaxID=986 RepID=A0A1M5QNW2_FLAJO|nr:hypothetical protein [Flavobacterium johnsoniae]SHH15785.1 hypothetical protein SAMN05444388_107110 [Flavobacterium johnsoniae]